MKPVLIACLLLISLSCDFPKKTTHVIDEKQPSRYVFVLSAKSGCYQNNELSLKEINSVIYFSDRPNRVAGHMELSKFPGIWKEKEETTKRCAILSIVRPEEEIVVELSNPIIAGNNITFTYKNIPIDFPKKFSACALFIDMASLDAKAFANLKPERSDFHSLTCSCAEAVK